MKLAKKVNNERKVDEQKSPVTLRDSNRETPTPTPSESLDHLAVQAGGKMACAVRKIILKIRNPYLEARRPALYGLLAQQPRL